MGEHVRISCNWSIPVRSRLLCTIIAVAKAWDSKPRGDCGSTPGRDMKLTNYFSNTFQSHSCSINRLYVCRYSILQRKLFPYTRFFVTVGTYRFKRFLLYHLFFKPLKKYRTCAHPDPCTVGHVSWFRINTVSLSEHYCCFYCTKFWIPSIDFFVGGGKVGVPIRAC